MEVGFHQIMYMFAWKLVQKLVQNQKEEPMAAGLLDGDRIHKSMFYHLRIKSREDVKFCKDLDLCMTVVPGWCCHDVVPIR